MLVVVVVEVVDVVPNLVQCHASACLTPAPPATAGLSVCDAQVRTIREKRGWMLHVMMLHRCFVERADTP